MELQQLDVGQAFGGRLDTLLFELTVFFGKSYTAFGAENVDGDCDDVHDENGRERPTQIVVQDERAEDPQGWQRHYRGHETVHRCQLGRLVSNKIDDF